ncbi:MAG TPA: MarR family transcriptional regulator [Thermomicrobiales bacterium]|nr:MarR family transcriptional regulator [Thermomicrobiales bacterium]
MAHEREGLLRELGAENRRGQAEGLAYLQAVAERSGLNLTDVQCIDILAATGPLTAGQLAELMGLTTGAVTGVVNRMERAGYVRREKDPDDGRRVVVSPVTEELERARAGLFAEQERALAAVLSAYDDRDLAVVLEILRQSNAMTREETARIRGATGEGEGGRSAPLEGVERGTFVFTSWGAKLVLRGDAGMADLYRAQFKGAVPEVRVDGGTVIMRYPRRLRTLFGSNQEAEVALNAAVPWRIELRNGASYTTADLRGLALAGLEIRGGASSVTVSLPAPTGTIPVRIAGGASGIAVKRPPGVEVSLRVKGWAAHLTFDEQTFDAVGSDVRLQSPGYADTDRRYDIEVDGGANGITVTTSG